MDVKWLLKVFSDAYLYRSASQGGILSPDFSQQEERSICGIWMASGNNMGIKKAEWKEREKGEG